jgi:hypothetical protein
MQDRHANRTPFELIENKTRRGVAVNADEAWRLRNKLKDLAEGLELDVDRNARSDIEPDLADDGRLFRKRSESPRVERRLSSREPRVAANALRDERVSS